MTILKMQVACSSETPEDTYADTSLKTIILISVPPHTLGLWDLRFSQW